MKVILTLPVAHPVTNVNAMVTDTSFLRTFSFHGYGDPLEVVRHESYGYVMKNGNETDLLPVWYMNANGFAQIFNPERPPYRKPACDCRDRVLLIPEFEEK